jgi:hypothetical protein
MRHNLRELRANNDLGASILEYVFLILLIGVTCVAGIAFFGEQASHTFSAAGTGFR